MKITERRLRTIIRSIIKEVRATPDEEILGDLVSYERDDFLRVDGNYQHNERVVQLFKAWCIKNNVSGMDAQSIVNMFFEDYPELSPSGGGNYYNDIQSGFNIEPELLDHAEQASKFNLKNKY